MPFDPNNKHIQPPAEDGRTAHINAAAPQRLPEFLAESGLTPNDVPTWSYLDCGAEIREALRTEQQFRGPGIQIPYLGLNGEPIEEGGSPFSRVRLLNKDDQANGKYQSPPLSGSHIYVPSRFQQAFDAFVKRTGKRSLFVCEGEKKAEAAVKADLPAVAIAGVWMYAQGRTREEQRKKVPKSLLPELVDVLREKQPETVVVVFDADGRVETNEFFRGAKIDDHKKIAPRQYVLNKSVNAAGEEFAALLGAEMGQRAVAYFTPFAEIEEPEKGAPRIKKQGLDDWLLAEGFPRSEAPRCPTEIFTQLMGAVREAEQIDAVTIEQAMAARQQRFDELEAAKGGGYIPLGYVGEQDVVVWNRARGCVVQVSTSKLTNVATIMSLAGPEFTLSNEAWQTKDEDDGKRGVDVIRAAADIIQDCTAAGPFTYDSAVRGSGVWRDPDDPDVLIVNASNGVWRIAGDGEPEEIEPCEAGRRHIYPRRAVAPRVMGLDDIADEWPVIENPEKDLISMLEGWAYKRPIDGALLAGWWCSTAYLGAIDARPGMFVTGESGSGKTTLFNLLSGMLGRYVQHIELASDSSTSGIRQMLKKDAIPVILDELEPGNTANSAGRKRAELVESLFRMLRASYSSGGENRHGVVKGSASGEAVDFSIMTAGLVGGVNVAQLEQADRNRMLVVELVPPEGKPQPVLPEGLDVLGDTVRNMMWRYWPHFRRNLPRVVAVVKEKLGKVDSRVPVTYGTALTAAAVYLVANEMMTDPDEIDQEILDFVNREDIGDAVHEHFTRGGEGGATDQQQAWDSLISFSLRIEYQDGDRERHETKTIAELVDAVADALQRTDGVTAGGRAGEYHAALQRHGLKVRYARGTGEIYVFIAGGKNTGRRWIESKINATAGSLVAAARRLATDRGGAVIADLPTQAKLAGVPSRGVWVLYRASGALDQQIG